LIPGVIGNPQSLAEESHSLEDANSTLVEYPTYTKPAEWRGLSVPEVLLSGNHGAIAAYRREQSQTRTEKLRSNPEK
jgi:tRNA (guanine37-N1)-methyltransferase